MLYCICLGEFRGGKRDHLTDAKCTMCSCRNKRMKQCISVFVSVTSSIFPPLNSSMKWRAIASNPYQEDGTRWKWKFFHGVSQTILRFFFTVHCCFKLIMLLFPLFLIIVFLLCLSLYIDYTSDYIIWYNLVSWGFFFGEQVMQILMWSKPIIYSLAWQFFIKIQMIFKRAWANSCTILIFFIIIKKIICSGCIRETIHDFSVFVYIDSLRASKSLASGNWKFDHYYTCYIN